MPFAKRGREDVAKISMIVKANRTPKYRCSEQPLPALRPAAGYIRQFAMCRICFRKLALEGQIPGVTKSSW